MKRAILSLAVSILAFAFTSRADQIYNVTGSLTITGNNTCSGPCIETIDFSFDFDEAVGQFGSYDLSILPGGTTTSSGSLGTFSLLPQVNSAWTTGGPDQNYIDFRNTTGSDFTEIDIWAAQNQQSTEFTPSIGGADLWGCDTQTCMANFCVPGESFSPCSASSSGPFYDVFTPGTVQAVVTAVPTPEPQTLWMLAGGVLLLFWFRRQLARSSTGQVDPAALPDAAGAIT